MRKPKTCHLHDVKPSLSDPINSQYCDGSQTENPNENPKYIIRVVNRNIQSIFMMQIPCLWTKTLFRHFSRANPKPKRGNLTKTNVSQEPM